MSLSKAQILKALDIQEVNSGISVGPEPVEASGEELVSYSPIDGEPIAAVRKATAEDYEQVVQAAAEAFKTWRTTPAPARGEIVREIGEELRKHKNELGGLVTLEMGKIHPEGNGEVQEMIDICDFATGQSRQLWGKTIASERPNHRLYEQWHPLGPIAVVTAFNFPVAVWSWNAALAGICGDPVIWKPSPKVPLTGRAVTNLANKVLARHNLQGLFNLLVGDVETFGDKLFADERIAMYSFTGSTRIGKQVAQKLAPRFVRTVFECGGNNAIIVDKDVDLELVARAVTFAAVGTAGQRCTTLRRLIIHKDVKPQVTERLKQIYEKIVPKIGNPLDEGILMGPMVTRDAVENVYLKGIERIEQEGGKVLFGNQVLEGGAYKSGCYVLPTLVESDQRKMPVVHEEVFAPILHLLEYGGELDEALELHNAVPQGLSSAVFSNNLRTAEAFLSAVGSDCGIANVNIGTSGAEIGGAFGGEKDTGGGRESGSDVWKNYMRRQTVTINYSTDLPLAQGIDFSV